MPIRPISRPPRLALHLALIGLIAVGACGSPGPAPVANEPGVGPQTGRAVRASRAGEFVLETEYLGVSGAAMGGRWVHERTGLPVVLLEIQSVPQVFLHVRTPPISDRGEPHTGEHLLLGKGRKGKLLSAAEDMTLVSSTAYTSQTEVVYAWNCSAGKETFYRSVQRYLDALLLPDYTDEEVRREVCNLGVSRDDATGTLTLDEKGTIYNEMVSSFEKRWLLWNTHQRRLWGDDHPLSYSSGGIPAAVREMEPEHIHAFHREHYHLSANLGMIVALPDSIDGAEFLEQLSGWIDALDTDPELAARRKTLRDLPPARPTAARGYRRIEYPNANEDDVGVALIAWPPVERGTPADQVLAELLLGALAEGEAATLYRRLMDRSTREVEVDASELFAWLESTPVDAAPYLGFDGLPPKSATRENMERIVAVMRDEIARVAGLADGGAELATFNETVRVKITEYERELKRQLSSPPLFGHRSARSFWLEHLRLVDRQPGDVRSVALLPVFEEIGALLASDTNPWAAVIERLGLAADPYVTVSVPSAAELTRRRDAKAARIEGYVEDLKQRFGESDGQAAIARYSEEYDRNTAELARLEEGLPRPRLVADVPLSMDPSIDLRQTEIGGVSTSLGVFENMSFAEVSLALSLGGVDPERYHWLPALPELLTSSGVMDGGAAVAYADAQTRRAREIYALEAEFVARPDRGRHELRVGGTGADLDEARRAVDWIEASLRHPWLTADNLPRIRDVISQAIRERRTQLGGREESWVRNPAGALQYQRDPLYLSMRSLHTQLFHLARCEWLLMEPPPPERHDELRKWMDRIVQATRIADDAPINMPQRCADFLATLDERQASNEFVARYVLPVTRRIRELVGDFAPGSVTADMDLLTSVALRDMLVPPEDALRELAALRTGLLRRASARLVMTGNSSDLAALSERVAELVEKLPDAPPSRTGGAPLLETGVLDARVLNRTKRASGGPGVATPAQLRGLHYGLVHQAGTSGVFVLSTAAAGLDDVDDETLTTELAGRAFGGSGAHGFFMQTWGAGLAYSNGVSVSASRGRMNYYAERCPDLVETMKFVTGLVSAAGTGDAAALADPGMTEYVVAGAVAYTRESDRYEVRTRAMADDIVDGDTPERVARWRSAVLALRERDDLWARVRPRIVAATGRVLPGVGVPSRSGEDGAFLTIAPPALLDRWEEWLRDREGETLQRIYGRDFWITPR